MHNLFIILGPIFITTGSLLGIFLLTNPESSARTSDDSIQLNTSEPEPVYRAKVGCENEWCTWKYWTHYEAKGCEPVYDTPASCCPSRFNCPKLTWFVHGTGCTYLGRFYAEGTNMGVHQCQQCQCLSAVDSGTGRPLRSCVPIKCLDMRDPLQPGCRRTFSEDECCSMGVDCTPRTTPATTATTTTTPEPVAECHVGHRSYARGESIRFDDDRCLHCTCVPGFRGPDGPGCDRKDNHCFLRQQEDLDNGCIPIFWPYGCCPSQWICPPEPSEPTADGCTFDGRHYARGAHLNATSHPCARCTCITPPEFTCVQQSFCPLTTGSG